MKSSGAGDTAEDTMIREYYYRMDWEDVKALERYRQRHGLRRVWFLLRTIGLPLLLIGTAAWAVREQGSWQAVARTYPIWQASLGASVILAAGLFGRLDTLRKLKRSGMLERAMSVSVQAEGLWRRDHSGESTVYWSTVSAIVNDRHHIFFFTTPDDTAVIVPKSAFTEPSLCREFYKTAMARWRDSCQPAAPARRDLRADVFIPTSL
jgi:hypothetical protein